MKDKPVRSGFEFLGKVLPEITNQNCDTAASEPAKKESARAGAPTEPAAAEPAKAGQAAKPEMS